MNKMTGLPMIRRRPLNDSPLVERPVCAKPAVRDRGVLMHPGLDKRLKAIHEREMWELLKEADRQIAWRLREIRLKRNVSLSYLCHITGLTYSKIKRCEHQWVASGALVRIAKDLDLPIACFFEPVGTPIPDREVRQ